MPDLNSISHRVLDTLVQAGLITVEQLSSAQEQAAGAGKTTGETLLERGLVTTADLATALEEEMGVPQVDLSSYTPDDSALDLVPFATAKARKVLPLFEIEGMLTVAIGDPVDVFSLDALASELGVEVEPVLADAASVMEAIAQYYADRAEPAAPVSTPAAEAPAEAVFQEEAPPPPPSLEDVAPSAAIPPEEEPPPAPVAEEEQHEAVAQTVEEVVETSSEAPAIDLDVLAVADSRKVAVLVSDILEGAVRRGANRIHLLPYKDDFFLVYRVKGRLEKVGSAPLGMQNALVEGFKGYAKLGSVPASQPALGRLHARLADKDLVLTVSVVPTIAGQRLVVNIAAYRPAPHTLPELGMNDAETKALQAMVERGRGVLLLAAPVNGGGSATYYSLLAYAASAGKTVYSVERNVDYEIPAVAQVMVTPGSPGGTSAYLATGIRQDTDMIAIDGLRTAEEAHLLIEAVGQGKLVLATVNAADVASGVASLLAAGVEPYSLSSALTMIVGQRLVRTNCPNCSTEEKSPLAAELPGASKDMVSKAGSGCPNCGKTGFAGVTGIFEILLVNEAFRAQVGAEADVVSLRKAAESAGMRPLAASGLAKVTSGEVAMAELDRVLRFS